MEPKTSHPLTGIALRRRKQTKALNWKLFFLTQGIFTNNLLGNKGKYQIGATTFHRRKLDVLLISAVFFTLLISIVWSYLYITTNKAEDFEGTIIPKMQYPNHSIGILNEEATFDFSFKNLSNSTFLVYVTLENEKGNETLSTFLMMPYSLKNFTLTEKLQYTGNCEVKATTSAGKTVASYSFVTLANRTES